MAMYEGYKNGNMDGLDNPIDMLAFYGFKGIRNRLQVNSCRMKFLRNGALV